MSIQKIIICQSSFVTLSLFFVTISHTPCCAPASTVQYVPMFFFVFLYLVLVSDCGGSVCLPFFWIVLVFMYNLSDLSVYCKPSFISNVCVECFLKCLCLSVYWFFLPYTLSICLSSHFICQYTVCMLCLCLDFSPYSTNKFGTLFLVLNPSLLGSVTPIFLTPPAYKTNDRNPTLHPALLILQACRR